MRMVRLSRCVLVIMLFLAIWNVGWAQDSLGMHHVATLDYWQGANDIQMVGDLAYVVSGASGLHIMDLSDSSHPTEVGRCTWFNWDDVSGGVYVTGDLAYVALGAGCRVYDVSEVEHPVLIAQWEGDEFGDIFVLGDIAIIQIEVQPVIFDISNLENVQLIGDFPGIIYPTSPIGMIDEYLCMNGAGISLWDMSEPTQPSRISAIDTTLRGPATVAGNYVYYATTEMGLRIINFSNPLQPVEVAMCDSGLFLGVTVTGIHAVVSKVYGLDIWNVSDPAHPIFESTLVSETQLTSLSSYENIICASNYHSSMAVTVVDISNPMAPVEVSSFGVCAGLHYLTIENTVGYLSGSLLQTLDLTEPAGVSVLGTYDMGGCFDVHGDYGYMVNASPGFCVFDLRSPTQPEYLSCYPIGVDRVVYTGDYAYGVNALSGHGWLRTISLQDPETPEVLNSQTIPNVSVGFGLAVSDGYLYLGAGIYSFYVYDLVNPAVPALIDSCALPHFPGAYVNDLVVTGNHAYVADMQGGLRIIDISNPAHPSEINSIGETTWRVAASGSTLITDGENGLRVWDVTDPMALSLVGYYATDEWLRDMDIAGSYLHTVSISRLSIYQCDALTNVIEQPVRTPNEFALYPCYPNPFNSTLIIPFTLPVQSIATITIYNILGQQVHQFDFPLLSPGAHRVLWDTNDMASGLYIVKLSTGRQEFRRKVVLLK